MAPSGHFHVQMKQSTQYFMSFLLTSAIPFFGLKINTSAPQLKIHKAHPLHLWLSILGGMINFLHNNLLCTPIHIQSKSEIFRSQSLSPRTTILKTNFSWPALPVNGFIVSNVFFSNDSYHLIFSFNIPIHSLYILFADSTMAFTSPALLK